MEKEINIEVIFGKRILVNLKGEIREVRIIDVSPSGKFLKLQSPVGVSWQPAAAVVMVELLEPIEQEQPDSPAPKSDYQPEYRVSTLETEADK